MFAFYDLKKKKKKKKNWIGKYVIKIRLGMDPFALGMPPFSGGADSAEKPLCHHLEVQMFKTFFNLSGT